MDKKLEIAFKYVLIMGFAFFIGVFTAFIKIYNDQENKNTGVSIMNRQINYPVKNCYNQEDLELIIYGKIQ
tara:strand:+ start:415 stop:627 length:213 start_codon:yes stop_codon:yes gene_type:complete